VDETRYDLAASVREPSSDCSIEVLLGDHEAVIAPVGDLDLRNRDRLSELFDFVNGLGLDRIVVDLERTPFLDLCVVQVFERQRSKHPDGVVFVNASGIVQRVLEVSGFGARWA